MEVTKEVKVSNSVLALDVWSHYLAIGSTSVQLVDMNSKKLRRIMVIDMDSAEEEDPLVSNDHHTTGHHTTSKASVAKCVTLL